MLLCMYAMCNLPCQLSPCLSPENLEKGTPLATLKRCWRRSELYQDWREDPYGLPRISTCDIWHSMSELSQTSETAVRGGCYPDCICTYPRPGLTLPRRIYWKTRGKRYLHPLEVPRYWPWYMMCWASSLASHLLCKYMPNTEYI